MTISHFSGLLCEDTRFKHLPICWSHLLLPSSGTRRHSALLFPASLSLSLSCFYTPASYVSSYQSLVLYWEHHQNQPLPAVLQSYFLIASYKLLTSKLARVTMTQSELCLPNYQPLLKYLSWTGTQLKKEEKRLIPISIKYIPGSIRIGAKDLYIPCLSVLRMEHAGI